MRAGLDLVDVADVADAVDRWGDRYLTRVFTPSEIAACGTAGRSRRIRHLAAVLAAKEATFKVLLAGDDELPWHCVEVTRGTTGDMSIRLSGAAQTYAEREQIAGLSVSLTCRQDHAAAAVLAEIRQSTTKDVDAP